MSSTDIVEQDLKIFLTGGPANQDPNLSFGGIKSSEEYRLFDVSQLFDSIDDTELSSGTKDYRIVAVENTHLTKTFRSVTLYFFFNTTNPNDFLSVALDPNGKNQNAQALGSETEDPVILDPPGWIEGENLSKGIQLGDMQPADFFNIIIRRIVNPGSQKQRGNEAVIAFEWDSEEVSIPPTQDPGGEVPESFTVALVGDMGCKSGAKDILDDISDRKVDLFVSLGNNAFKSGSQCWLEILEKERLIGKTFVAFGEKDVNDDFDQPETKNALISAFGIPNTYYTKIFKNIFFLIYDSESNPELSPQFAEMQEELNRAANDSTIEWIFVVHNRPFYSPQSVFPNDSTVRDVWHPIWDDNKVDIVFSARNQNQYFTKILKYNSVDPDTPTIVNDLSTDNTYSYSRSDIQHGILFVGSGNGGKDEDDIDDFPNHMFHTKDNEDGYVLLDFQDNGKTCIVKAYDDDDDLHETIILKHV